jgi:DNA-binding NarL/FixJ family response regulator
MPQQYNIIIVDDHNLIAKGIAALIGNMSNYNVQAILSNGKELVEFINSTGNKPSAVLLDINMPIMDGFATMQWMQANASNIPVLCLTVNNDEQTIIKMIRLGARGYLTKDTALDELQLAIHNIIHKGYYQSAIETMAMRKQLTQVKPQFNLKDKQLEFLLLCCSDYTYVQIAQHMHLSPKTVDHYRDALFEKFGVKSRVGLVLYAISNNIILHSQIQELHK